MRLAPGRFLRVAVFTVAGFGLVGAGAAYLLRGRAQPDAGDPPAAERRLRAELVPGAGLTIRLHPEDVAQLSPQTTEVRTAPPPRPLQLPGTLLLDPGRLARVRSRFAGEVVEVSTPDGTPDNPPGRTEVSLGRQVEKDQLLAVVWSKDLGEKKSELVDALSRLRLDLDVLHGLEETYHKGAAPERSLREAERNVEADRIAVERARRTLRAWRLSDEEIRAVEQEAQQSFPRAEPAIKEAEAVKRWARVEVRAPFRGVVLEINITRGDVVDTTLDLFKVADLDRLRVTAHAPEEDVAVLQRLKPDQRLWNVRLMSEPDAPPLRGAFDQIGLAIDPNQRTAAVTGDVENPPDAHGGRKLRVGQLILAEIPLPAPVGEVVVPRTAVVQQGRDCSVFVQADPAVSQFTCRKVALVRQSRAFAHLRAEPTPEEARHGYEPLKPGERVVCTGAIEVAAALKELSDGRR